MVTSRRQQGLGGQEGAEDSQEFPIGKGKAPFESVTHQEGRQLDPEQLLCAKLVVKIL